SFKNVMNSLNTDYVVVRPDHIFQLIRQANNLSVNPGGVEGTGEGLTGTYYNGTNFETLVGTNNEATINFDWGTGSPMTGVNADGFSARWTGQVQPRYSGTYTFYLTSDNNRRVWINNQLIIDKWITGQSTYSGTIALTGGQKYDIEIEYAENTGTANCKLEWASPLQAREVIPQSQLYNAISSVDAAKTSEISISPNPIENGVFSIKTNATNQEVLDLTLCDLYGKIVLREKVQESKQVDVAKIPAGTYIVSIRSKYNNYVKKVVVR
ncbi:MAG TPA: PA14 domain-containing protein, partial [Paludibacter sp.]